MTNIVPNLATLSLLTAVVAVIVSMIVHVAQLRQLRITANERFMNMVLEIDKMIIAEPSLGDLYWPGDNSLDVSDVPPKLKAFMYMHINMFDVVYNYYVRSLPRGWLLKRVNLKHEEIDNWEGWQSYMEWLIKERMDSNEFFNEAELWFSADFIRFLKTIAARPSKSPRSNETRLRNI